MVESSGSASASLASPQLATIAELRFGFQQPAEALPKEAVIVDE